MGPLHKRTMQGRHTPLNCEALLTAFIYASCIIPSLILKVASSFGKCKNNIHRPLMPKILCDKFVWYFFTTKKYQTNFYLLLLFCRLGNKLLSL